MKFKMLLLVLIFTNVLFGKNIPNFNDSTFHVSLNLGVSKVDLQYVNPPNWWQNDFKIGYSVGLTLDYTFYKPFSIGIGLGFNSFGDRKRYDYLSPLVQYDSTKNQYQTIDTIQVSGFTEKSFRCVSVPINVYYAIKTLSTSIFVGSSFGYIFQSDENIGGAKNGYNPIISGHINKLIYQIQGGFYYTLPGKLSTLQTGLMYSQAINNISKPYFWYSDFKPNEIRLMVKVLLKPGSRLAVGI